MALPLVVFPDVELWLTGYLQAALADRPEAYAASVYVGNAKPTTDRARMVVVRRDGGRRTGPALEAARVGVRVWAGTEQEVNDLSRLVRALLHNAPTAPGPITRAVDQSGPSSVPDEKPLRYLVIEFIVRGSALSPT